FISKNNRSHILCSQDTNNQNIELKYLLNDTLNRIKYIHLSPNLMNHFTMETIATPNCNTSTLAPFEPSSQNPWDTRKINHVYRRLGFGASQDDVDDALSLTPGQFINLLVDTAHNMPPTPSPYWGYYSNDDFSDYEGQNYPFFEQWRLQSTKDLLQENLRGRLAFFWMNHFVTRFGI